MPTTMMSRTACLFMLNGQLNGKKKNFWWLRNTNLVVSHWRYLSENEIHSCGMMAYDNVMSANTPTAPAMHSAQVAGRSGLGRRISTATMTRPSTRMPTAQRRRPAGRIHGNQSGIRLGIGPVVLREARGGVSRETAVSSRTLVEGCFR